MRNKTIIAIAVLFLFTAFEVPAQVSSSKGSNHGISIRSTSVVQTSGGKNNIFDHAISGSKIQQTTGAEGNARGTSSSAARKSSSSPFGVTSTVTGSSSTVKKRKQWPTTCKASEFFQTEVLPPNTNFSFSGTITDIHTDANYFIVTMFDAVKVIKKGVTSDVPVTYTVVIQADQAETMSLRVKAKKTFKVDGNYVYFFRTAEGYHIRAVDNSLTEEDVIQ